MSADVICISSDDDELETQETKTIVASDNIKLEQNKSVETTAKRKERLSSDSESPAVKRAKLKESSPICAPVEEVPKPTLIVKERRSVSPVDHHPFPMFVSLCLQKDRTDDMQNIVSKLQRSFDRLDKVYKTSPEFKAFLNEKRNALTNDKKSKFIYILDVIKEMKARIHGSSTLLCDRATNSQDEDESDSEELQRKKSKIRRIDKAMRKCEMYIKKFESTEVDFEDENDSTYMKLERYKRRIVELYTARCRLTGESSDAGRSYLRPRRLKPTGISAIDEAITKLVNTKISKRNKLKNIGSAVDSFVFPNYSDILGCIHQCNEVQNLGFNSSKLENTAKTAFTQLGEYLQRVRRNDYWDTFSLYLENQNEDPAKQDAVLAAKLAESQREGQKRLANVLQKYVDEQEKLSEAGKEEEVEESEEDEEEEESEEENVEKEDWEKEAGSESSEETKSRKDASPARDSSEENSICPAETVEDQVSVEPVARTPPDNLPSCDTLVTAAVPLSSAQVSGSGSEDEGTPVIASGLHKDLGVIERASLAEECDECDAPETKDEEKPILRLRSFAKPPTTWNDEKSPDCQRSQVDLVDLTQSPSPAKPSIGRHRPNSICIVKNINNNHELNGKRLRVIDSGKVTVLNQVLGTNVPRKSIAGAKVIKVITNVNSQGQCVRKRIQPQTIAVLHPTTSTARKK